MNDDNELRDQLGAELRQRVDGMHDAPLTLADVKGRAGSIRRNRRLATAAGVAAALVVIVPVAVFAGQGLGDQGSVPPATQSPGPSPTRATDSSAPTPDQSPTSDASPGPVQTLALDGDFPAGPPPALPYLDGTQLIRHDQDPVELPEAFDSFALLGDRFVGTYAGENVDRMVGLIDVSAPSSYQASLSQEVVDGIAVSDAGTTVAYGTPGGTIETVWADGQVQLANNLGEPVSVRAVVGDGSCHEVDGGCRVFFNSATSGPPRAADSHGIVDTFAPGALRVNDVSPTGLIAVQTSSTDDGSCSGVYSEETSDYLFETCDNTLQTFSPDGGRLLAGPAYLDGLGDGSLTVLDTATGDPLAQFEIDGGFISDATWEDDEHLLVTTYGVLTGGDVQLGQLGWRILRVGLDGSINVVAGPNTTADDVSRPYTLPAS